MVKLTDKDLGYAKLVRRVFDLAKSKPRIAVGILEGERKTSPVGGAPSLAADEEHPLEKEEGGEAPNRAPVTLIEIATWNEFGTWNIPARSFIGSWFDGNSARMRDVLVPQLQSVVEGKFLPDVALERVGLWAVGQIQKNIADGIDPENAQSTIDRKGSSKPLIDEGILRSSISCRVEFA